MTHLDERNLQELIDAHGAALTLYARQWCRAPEDAVQEALVDLLRTDPHPNDPVAWLYTTTRRRAMNVARAESRRAKHHRQASQETQAWFVPNKDDLDDLVNVESALAGLPPLEREIVVARIWGRLSFAQIAELVEQSSSAVHRRYKRTLAELREVLNRQLSEADR